jgi:tripartite-type tricarboxylate transporter receptor subunit TctC
MNNKTIGSVCIITALLCCSSADADSTFPDRQIRVVVPYETGGGADLVPRIAFRYLSTMLNVPIIIDNRPGAGGIIGTQVVMKAAPDGYTLLDGITGAMAINPSIYPKLPYDPVKDFAPVAMLAIGQNVLVVNPSLPVKNVRELINYAKAHPGKLNFGSSGTGGAPHMAGELLKSMASIDMVHVPYKGAAAALVDLMSGNVQLTFGGLGSTIPQIKAGKVRALAVAGSRRSPAMPDLPTIGETLKGYEAATWFGIFAPAGTPKNVVDKLSNDLAMVMARPDVVQQLLVAGYEPYVMNAEELGPFVAAERSKWAKVIKDAHIVVQ